MIPAELLPHATDRQREIAEAINEHGGAPQAAKVLGVNRSYVTRAMQALERKAIAAGWKPPVEEKPVAGKRILVLPDVQAKPGNDFSYLMRIGQYMVEKKPDIVVCIGDFADLCSLSQWDKGKKAFEGRRYTKDIDAAKEAMSAFLTPMVDYNAAHPKKPYKPRMVLTLGNHEERILRATNDDAKLDGLLSIDDLQYKDFGWEVYPFLQTVTIEGVLFSHYLTSGVKGLPVTSAQALLTKKHISCVVGHQQGLQIATAFRGDGVPLTAVIAGSCYEHDEPYMGPQGNKHWRGFLMLHDTREGMFDLMPVSLSYINKKYAHIKVAPDYSKVPMPELAPR